MVTKTYLVRNVRSMYIKLNQNSQRLRVKRFYRFDKLLVSPILVISWLLTQTKITDINRIGWSFASLLPSCSPRLNFGLTMLKISGLARPIS